MCVEMEGEHITPEEFHQKPGWLHIGSIGKVTTSNTQDATGEPQASIDPGIKSHASKNSHGKNVRKEVLRAPRFITLPAEEIKIVIRPQEGLDIAKKGAASVAPVIMAAAEIEKTDRADAMACPSFPQNIMTV